MIGATQSAQGQTPANSLRAQKLRPLLRAKQETLKIAPSPQVPEIPISEKLISRVANSDILCFDVDDTLNHGRSQPIDEEAAELVFQFLLAGKKIAFISGRTYEEFKKIGTLDPLLRLIRERNLDSELTVYSAGGAEKVIVKPDGTSKHDSKYDDPYTDFESRRIMGVLDSFDKKVDQEQHLRSQGIARFLVNYRNLVYQWSPYGKKKEDEQQYDFEKIPNGGAQYKPARLTRKALGKAIVAQLSRAGIDNIEATVSGKTTVGFSKKGVNKKTAMLDLLKHGRVTYFGDEVSRQKSKTGNDNIIGEMARDHSDQLTVVALDENAGTMPDKVFKVGGLLQGTLRVLKRAHFYSEAQSKPFEIVSKVLANYDLGNILSMLPLKGGLGSHKPFLLIESKKGKFILRHIRQDLFRDDLKAARCEVLCVNTLRANGVPVAEIAQKTQSKLAKGQSVNEDNYISVGPDKKCYLLYRYVEGEVGSFDTMNPRRYQAMIALLANFHKVVEKINTPYTRDYIAPSILGLLSRKDGIVALHEKIANKKALNPRHEYTRGERLVFENALFISRQLESSISNLKPVYELLPQLFVHSDLNPRNVIFSGDRIVGVIDLEHMRREARIYDLVPPVRMETAQGRFDLRRVKEVVLAYHKLNPLTVEEVVALPEIFRLKLVDRASRLVDFRTHHEAGGFKFSPGPEEERSIQIIDRSSRLFSWFRATIMALRDLDARVAQGDFKREIQDRIEHDGVRSSLLFQGYLKELNANPASYPIDVAPLASFNLNSMLKESRPVREVCKKDGAHWCSEGNFFYNSRRKELAWCRLQAEDQVIFYTDTVVAYLSSTGNIFARIKGNEFNKKGDQTEQALIEIVLDDNRKVRAVHMLPSSTSGLDLSRSAVAIQLTDSGMFDKFPVFHKLLKYQLVWQDVDGGLRHREVLDSYDIQLDLLRRVRAAPASVDKAKVTQLTDFRYFKSRPVRRQALSALGLLYDNQKVSRSEYVKSLAAFIDQDIQEDFRVIERIIKNDPNFLQDTFKNLFGRENISLKEIARIHIKYFDQDSAKQLHHITFEMVDGSKKQGIIALVRHDPIDTQAGMREEQIRTSVRIWRDLSLGGVPGIVRYGGEGWERDYRNKHLIHGGTKSRRIREEFVNDIHVSSRQLQEGRSLHEILVDPNVPRIEKSRASRICQGLARQFFHASKMHSGKGYFMDQIEPRNFTLNQVGGKLKASLTDTSRLVDYPSVTVLIREFKSRMKKYQS